MNREAQTTKQAPMPTIAKTWALRRAKLCVVLLRRLSRKRWLVASFGFCDIPLVWNIGGSVVKPLCSLFQLLHYPLEECGRHRYCETPRATTATTTSWWMRLAFAEVSNRIRYDAMPAHISAKFHSRKLSALHLGVLGRQSHLRSPCTRRAGFGGLRTLPVGLDELPQAGVVHALKP